MCGRWATPFTKENIELHYKVTVSGFSPSYNIVPGDSQIVITGKDNKAAEKMVWGLVPSWTKDISIGHKLINARSETLLEKPSFRQSFVSRRCLVPCGGFYEWKTFKSEKIPYYFRLKNEPLFSLAGLYDRWRSIKGAEMHSFTIITTAANAIVAPIHTRMPVILEKKHEDQWLSSSDTTYLYNLLRSYKNSKDMEVYPVSKSMLEARLI